MTNSQLGLILATIYIARGIEDKQFARGIGAFLLIVSGIAGILGK